MCDYEPPLVYSSTLVKARKTHLCCECFRSIEPKEIYEKVTGLWGDDEKWRTFKTCLQCLILRRAIAQEQKDDCFAHDFLSEEVQWVETENPVLLLKIAEFEERIDVHRF